MPVGDSVVIGDSVWDLLAARRARALGLLSGGYGQDELEWARIRLKHLYPSLLVPSGSNPLIRLHSSRSPGSRRPHNARPLMVGGACAGALACAFTAYLGSGLTSLLGPAGRVYTLGLLLGMLGYLFGWALTLRVRGGFLGAVLGVLMGQTLAGVAQSMGPLGDGVTA